MDFNIGKLKELGRKAVDRARQVAEGLTPLEVKVEEATNDDKWGPHGQLMAGAAQPAQRSRRPARHQPRSTDLRGSQRRVAGF